jgi:hypothetical protein
MWKPRASRCRMYLYSSLLATSTSWCIVPFCIILLIYELCVLGRFFTSSYLLKHPMAWAYRGAWPADPRRQAPCPRPWASWGTKPEWKWRDRRHTQGYGPISGPSGKARHSRHFSLVTHNSKVICMIQKAERERMGDDGSEAYVCATR